MRNFIEVYNSIKGLEEIPTDTVLLLRSSPAIQRQVPLENYLAQFKFCKNHEITGEAYDALLAILAQYYTPDVLKRLEGCSWN